MPVGIELRDIPRDKNIPEDRIDTTNYASNQRVVNAAKKWIFDQLGPMVTIRSTMTNKFQRWNALAQGKHTQRLYKGRSDVFIPRGMTTLHNHVDRIHTKTFPFSELVVMRPKNKLGQMRLPLNKLVLERFIDDGGIKDTFPLFLMEALKLGTGVMKSPWAVRKTRQYRRVPTVPYGKEAILPPGAPRTKFERRDVTFYEGPSPQAVDLLRWFIHPITARKIKDYEIIFEDMDFDPNYLMYAMNEGEFDEENTKKLLSMIEAGEMGAVPQSSVQSEINSNRDERLIHMGHRVKDQQIKSRITQVLEIWCRFPLFKYAGKAKDTHEDIDCKMVIGFDGSGNPLPLTIKQSPFPTQHPPYHAYKVRERMDSFYGHGQMETMEGLQLMLNAFFNLGIDSANFTINQLAVVDMNRLPIDPKKVKFAPLNTIPVQGKPSDVIEFVSPPPVYEHAIQMATVIASLMEDDSQAPAIAQGRVTTGIRNATHAGILAAAANVFEDAAIERLESNVLTPMVKFWMMSAERFLSAQGFLDATQIKKDRMGYDAVMGDADMEWRVSRQAARAEQLQQQLLEQEVNMRQLQMYLATLTGQMTGTPSANPGKAAGSTQQPVMNNQGQLPSGV